MTKPQKIEGGWVDDFDKINLCGCTRVCYGHDELKEQLKAFISDLRASERQRCVEDCLKLVPEWIDNLNGEVNLYTCGRRDERKEIRSFLEQLK